MKKSIFTALVSIIVCTLVFAGCSSQEPESKTLKIGYLLGLTGPGSQMFLEQKEVVMLAEEWLNNKGGITVNGEKYKIQVVFEDDKNTPADCITAATRLISKEGIKFIVGVAVPDQVAAVASVTEKNGVLYASSGIDMMHPEWKLQFVMKYAWTSPVPGLYDTMLQLYPEVKNVGYIVEDEGGARAIAGVAQKIAKSRGLNTLEPQFHPWEAKEYAPQWNVIMSQKPDAVDIGLKMPDANATCIKQGRQAGFTGPIISTVSADPTSQLNMIGKEYATDFFLPGFDPYGEHVTPMIKEVVNTWGKNHTNLITQDGISGWDTLWVMVQVIEKAQSFDPEVVAKTWENLDTLETTRGMAKMGGGETFGINHMVFAPAPITRLQNGQIVFIKWIDTWVP